MMPGIVGGIIVKIGFAAALAAAFFYYRVHREGAKRWLIFARNSYHLAVLSLVSSSAIFLYLILTHQFQYTYVWSYSSTTLPLPLLISTFYAGQEGSFTLWALYTSIIGVFLMMYASRKDYEPEVMAVYSLILSFLLLMLVVKNPFAMIWSSFPKDLIQTGPIPAGVTHYFMLDAARNIWAQYPAEGRGLNPLLQNYWMVIHPQILFTGFSSMAVPYTLAVAGLWKRDYKSWIRVATPWSAFGAMVLGTGIILGGYWAYETLGWGGYWGWDPVENSSLIPWLLCVASIHTTLTQRKSGAFVRTNFVLSLLTFVMVLYSTFLTRSGVLGDTSVHSFVDPGMWVYWLLLAFLVLFTTIGFGLLFARMKEMSRVPAQHSILSREFALLLGAFALTFVALFEVVGTSSPLITGLIRGKASAVEVGYYVKTNLPLGIIITVLSGLGQLLWWQHSKAGSLLRSMAVPLVLALVVTLIELFSLGTAAPLILLFTFCAGFSLFSNLQVGYGIFMGNPKFVGGSIAHIGIAIMCLGFVTSSRYDTKTTVPLEKGKPVRALGYTLTYMGYKQIDNERYAFNVAVQRGNIERIVSPMMHFNTQENSTIRHPDLINFINRDFYVSPVSIETPDDQGSQDVTLKKGESADIGGVKVEFVDFVFSDEQREAMMEGKRFTINVDLTIADRGKKTSVTMKMENGPGGPKYLPGTYRAAGSKKHEFNLVQMMPNQDDPAASKVEFAVKLPEAPSVPKREETLVIEASIKPMINLVWMGTVTLIVGFALTIFRRAEEARLKDGTSEKNGEE
jgi:cytochrome c-type biogenesis protein CcmF